MSELVQTKGLSLPTKIFLCFAAIIVAFVARLNPVGIFFASPLMALLYLGGEQAQQYLALPSSISNVFQGMLLTFLLGSDVFINYRLRWKEAVA